METRRLIPPCCANCHGMPSGRLVDYFEDRAIYDIIQKRRCLERR